MAKSSGKSKRIFLFDALKLFAIFLVLWGHVIQHLLSSDHADEPVYRVIYSFHMPLFIMITGFFFAMTFKPGFIHMAVKKCRTLIYPVIIWVIAFFAIRAVAAGLPTMSHFLSNLNNDFWFLKSAFVCCIVSYPACRYPGHRLLFSVIALLFTQLPLDHKLQLPYMYPCFLAGMFMQWKADDLKKISPVALLSVSGAALVVGNIFLDAEMYRSSFDAIYNQTLWDDSQVILLRVYRIVLGLSGSLFVICLFAMIARRRTGSPLSTRIVAMLGAETLGIYLVQTYLLEFALRRAVSLDSIPPLLFNAVAAPLLAVVLLLICYAIIRLLKLNRYSATFFFGVPLAERKEKP